MLDTPRLSETRTYEGDTMADMGKHSTLTTGQEWLLGGFAAFGAVLMPLSFVVMFLTVNTLLAPYMGGWAWTVPIGTEAGFTGLFLAAILLESRRRPARLLHLAPYAFAAVSLWLNAQAAHGDLVGMVGHSVLPMVFFGYLLAAKVLVKRLGVSDGERRREVAVSDAVAHARDILRAADRWWRLRAPVLLRRQLRTRRLPAAVIEAIDGGAAVWEPAVEAWITRSLALPEGVSALLAAARAEASSSTLPAVPDTPLPAVPETVLEPVPVPEPETAPETAPETSAKRVPARVPRPALKLTAARSRGMSPERLAVHVAAMIEEYGEASLNRVKEDLHVGTAKARAAMEIAVRGRRGGDVVPMERRAAR